MSFKAFTEKLLQTNTYNYTAPEEPGARQEGAQQKDIQSSLSTANEQFGVNSLLCSDSGLSWSRRRRFPEKFRGLKLESLTFCNTGLGNGLEEDCESELDSDEEMEKAANKDFLQTLDTSQTEKEQLYASSPLLPGAKQLTKKISSSDDVHISKGKGGVLSKFKAMSNKPLSSMGGEGGEKAAGEDCGENFDFEFPVIQKKYEESSSAYSEYSENDDSGLDSSFDADDFFESPTTPPVFKQQGSIRGGCKSNCLGLLNQRQLENQSRFNARKLSSKTSLTEDFACKEGPGAPRRGARSRKALTAKALPKARKVNQAYIKILESGSVESRKWTFEEIVQFIEENN